MARKLYCPDCGQPVERLYAKRSGKYIKTGLAWCHNVDCTGSDRIPDNLEAWIKSDPLTHDPNLKGGDQ